jgi:hypothetical protein
VTGVAPADETAATPTAIPAEAHEVAGGRPDPSDYPPTDSSVQVAYLHGSKVSTSWHKSLMDAVAYDKSVGLNVLNSMPFSVFCGGPNSLVEGRNMAAAHFLDNTPHEWLLFTDTDMGFEPDAIERLLLAADPVERPVVGGLCFMLRHMGADNKNGYKVLPIPTLFMFARNPGQGVGFASRFIYPPDALVQVAGTGAAFLLIHRSVLEKIRVDNGDKWFDFVHYGDGAQVSEDLSFCWRVNAAGFPIFVHTGVRITHHKEFWLGEDDYKMPPVEPMQRMMDAVQRPHLTCLDVSGMGELPESRFVCGPNCPKAPCSKCKNISCDGGWGCAGQPMGETE